MFYFAKIHIISGMECFFLKLSEKNKDECLADGACMTAPFVADGHTYPGVLLVLCDWYYAIVRIGKPILKVEWIYVLAPPAVYKKRRHRLCASLVCEMGV